MDNYDNEDFTEDVKALCEQYGLELINITVKPIRE